MSSIGGFGIRGAGLGGGALDATGFVTKFGLFELVVEKKLL
jgi:hypothetical protein